MCAQKHDPLTPFNLNHVVRPRQGRQGAGGNNNGTGEGDGVQRQRIEKLLNQRRTSCDERNGKI